MSMTWRLRLREGTRPSLAASRPRAATARRALCAWAAGVSAAALAVSGFAATPGEPAHAAGVAAPIVAAKANPTACRLPGAAKGLTTRCLSTSKATGMKSAAVKKLYRSADTVNGRHVHVYPGTLANNGSVLARLSSNGSGQLGIVTKKGITAIASTGLPDVYDQVARSGKYVAWMGYDNDSSRSWHVYVYNGTTVREVASKRTVPGAAKLTPLTYQDIAIAAGKVRFHLASLQTGTQEATMSKLVSVPLKGGKATVKKDCVELDARSTDGTVYRVKKAKGGWNIVAKRPGHAAKTIYRARGEGSASLVAIHVERGVVLWQSRPHGYAGSGSVIYAYQPGAHRLTRITTSSAPNAYIDLSIGSGRLAFGDTNRSKVYVVNLTKSTVASVRGQGASSPSAMLSPNGRILWRAIAPISGSSAGIQADARAFAVARLR